MRWNPLGSNGLVRTLAIGGALASSAIACGDFVKRLYASPTFYHYKVTHMPDLDQLRDDLPSDGGMYCVPTATVNMFCYAANHGMPGVSPGPGNWQSASKYDQATSAISVAGSFMGTDPIGGTAHLAWSTGTQLLCIGWASGALTRQAFFTSDDYTVRMHKIAQAASTGALASIAYGRYRVTAYDNKLNAYQVVREGGHAVTLVEAYRLGSGADDAYVRVRDPADSSDSLSTQSFFVNREIDSDEIAITSALVPLRVVTALNFTSEFSLRIVDSVVLLRPTGVLGFLPSGESTQIVITQVPSFAPPPPPVTLTTNPLSILDVSFDSDSLDALMLGSYGAAVPLNRLIRVNMLTGEQTILVSGAVKRFTTGRDGQIYHHDGTTIRCIRADGTAGPSTTAVAGPAAIAYDDATDRVVVLSVANRRLTRLSSSLSVISSVDIPTSIPVSGDSSVCVDTDDGSVFFVTDGNSSLHRLAANWATNGFSSFPVAGVTAPRSISAGDEGRLFVTTSGVLRALKRSATGGWQQDTASPFHLLPSSTRMSMMRSRTNYDPAQHSGPAWRELRIDEIEPLGVEVPDCLADIDGDGVVGSTDLARFLANWGGTDPTYDFNADGVANSQDLGVLLATWGPCP